MIFPVWGSESFSPDTLGFFSLSKTNALGHSGATRLSIQQINNNLLLSAQL